MTSKHVIDGLMQVTKARSHYQLARIVGINEAAISRIIHDKCIGLSMNKIESVQQLTGVPFDTLFAWYRLPKDAVLGRIAIEQEAA